MIRAALYCRKSTDDERHDGKSESVERQIENGKAFAAQQGWTVEHVYQDVAISGGNFERPGLLAMLDALKAKKLPFDYLVVMEQSRLGRDVARTMLLIEGIEDAGVRIFGYQDGRQITLHDESGENAVALRGIIDNSEKRRARGRTREGQAKKAKGGHVVGAVPFGYTGVRDANDEHTEYAVNEEHRATVVRIFSLYAAGHGCKKIMKTLRDEGAPAPGALGWSKNTIKNLLKRPIYCGVLRFRCSTGDAKVRNQANEITVDRPDLRIVPEDLERRVRERQSYNKATMIRSDGSTKKLGTFLSKPESNGSATHLCNVICKCHVCGSSLIYWNRGGRRRSKNYYVCSRRVHRGKGSCANDAGVPVEALDYGIQVKLQDMLNNNLDAVLDILDEQYQVWQAKQALPKDQRTQLEREKARLQRAIDRLMDQIELGQAIGDRLKKRQEELDTIKAKLEMADTPDFDRESVAANLRPYGPLIGLGEGDPVTIRQILRKIGVTAIIVEPDGNGWKFTGQANFQGAVHPRTHEGPPTPPALGDGPAEPGRPSGRPGLLTAAR